MKEFNEAQDFVNKVTNTSGDERHNEQASLNENRAQRRERERNEHKLERTSVKNKQHA